MSPVVAALFGVGLIAVAAVLLTALEALFVFLEEVYACWRQCWHTSRRAAELQRSGTRSRQRMYSAASRHRRLGR